MVRSTTVTSTARGGSPGGVRILDRLRDEGRINAAQYESVYHRARRTGERIEETLLEAGAIDETELLRFIAALYKTRFVGTARLARADIDPATLDLVPRRVAERLQCVPILHDKRTQTLSVVAFDFDNDLAKQLQVVTGAREVRVFVARPAAVRAAIRKFYAGDPHAFATLAGPAPSPATGLEAFERLSAGGALEIDLVGPTGGPEAGSGLTAEPGTPSAAASRPVARARALDPGPVAMPAFEVAPDFESFLETVHVLVTLLDASRGELRNHSSQVGRLSRRIAERLSLSPYERNALVAAAYLHDVGKASTYHLTALNVSRFDGHRLQAQRCHLAPLRLFESARLPDPTVRALEHLHERYDGQGFPDRLKGNDIPLGARVISLVETYCDLTVNPKNPYRRTLSPKEAIDVVRQLASQLFDPVLVDHLRHVVLGEHAASDGSRTRVLLVDPDRHETTMLEVRLQEAGHDVVLAWDAASAHERALAQRFDLVISEVELGERDGLALLAALRADPSTRDVPFVFLARRADRESIARGLALGAADYLVKPASAEIVVAKTAHLLETARRKRAAVLAGSLRDVGLAEVIQTLGNGRKTGLLRITSAGQHGEVHFLEGAVANASFGAHQREDALYAMLSLTDGDFAFDPTFKPTERLIRESTEALLLEGMRRIDERGA